MFLTPFLPFQVKRNVPLQFREFSQNILFMCHRFLVYQLLIIT